VSQRILVISNRHELVPLFHRLRRQGEDAELVIWNSRFEDAWSGLVKQVVRRSDGSLTQDNLAPAIEAAEAGEVTVVTATRKAAGWFSGAQRLFGPGPEGLTSPADRVLFGGWFDREQVQAPHLLVADWGVWTGGMGPAQMGGLTLVRLGDGGSDQAVGRSGEVNINNLPAPLLTALGKVTDLLKTASFRGLFYFDVAEDPASGEMELRGLAAGWPWLHTQAFMAELENLGGVLGGEIPRLSNRFVTVMPVSVPPWPNPRQGGRREPVELTGLTPQQQGRMFWFDITVDAEHRQVWSAGLDGLLGVATGSSDSTPELARLRAVELAMNIEVPEKQFRADAAGYVDNALAALEDRLGISVL
jgi:hypothetical protein